MLSGFLWGSFGMLLELFWGAFGFRLGYSFAVLLLFLFFFLLFLLLLLIILLLRIRCYDPYYTRGHPIERTPAHLFLPSLLLWLAHAPRGDRGQLEARTIS